MIEGIKIAVTSYKDSEESANLAAQISFFIAKERKNQVFLIVNTEYDLIDKMRGRTELNDVTFCKGEPELNTGLDDEEKTRIYIYDLGKTNGPIPMSDQYKKIYIVVDNSEIQMEQAKEKISSITDADTLVTELLKNPDNNVIKEYKTVAKGVIKTKEDEFLRCPYDVKEDLDTFSHKAGFCVPDPKKMYTFDKLPIKDKEEPVKNGKSSFFGKKKVKAEKDSDVSKRETSKVDEKQMHEPAEDPTEASDEISDNSDKTVDAAERKPAEEPELKKSIYGDDDDDDCEKEGMKEKLTGFVSGMKTKTEKAISASKEKADQRKNEKAEEKQEEAEIQPEERAAGKPLKKPQRQEPANPGSRRREPDYAGKIQSLKDKSQFIYTIITFVNLCLIVAIFITGINFAKGFRDKCHTPVKAEEIVISKVPTTSGISGIEIKNYSGVAKNKRVAVIIGEDTFIRPYTESMKDLKKKTSVKTKRYAVTVSFTDDPFIQSMFGELTFVHHSALGESMFSNDDYNEIIAYAKKYYTKKKYDFFKYKDKDSIQPGTAPVSMIQDLEED